MKKRIFIFCLIAVLTAAGASTSIQNTKQIPAESSTPLPSKATTILSTEKETNSPLVEPISTTEATTPLQAKNAHVEPMSSTEIPEIEQTQPSQTTQSTNVTNSTSQQSSQPPKQQNPNTIKPKMGDRRVHNGENQFYFEGFGWILDEGGGSVGTTVGNVGDELTGNKVGQMGGGTVAYDMYENGNKVGIMGGGKTGDSTGDINKMVGIMGGSDEAKVQTKSVSTVMPIENTEDTIYQELQPTPQKNSTPPTNKPNNSLSENDSTSATN